MYIILGEFSNEMSIFMTFPTSEWELLIIDRLDPILVFPGQFNFLKNITGYIHINKDLGIRGVP